MGSSDSSRDNLKSKFVKQRMQQAAAPSWEVTSWKQAWKKLPHNHCWISSGELQWCVSQTSRQIINIQKNALFNICLYNMKSCGCWGKEAAGLAQCLGEGLQRGTKFVYPNKGWTLTVPEPRVGGLNILFISHQGKFSWTPTIFPFSQESLQYFAVQICLSVCPAT